MAKLKPFVLRRLIFLTLVVASCCFVIGIAWYTNQPAQQTLTVTQSTSQTSPLIPIPPEILLHPVDKEAGKQNALEGRENQNAFTSPKLDNITPSPSLNPDIPRDNSTVSGQAASSPKINGIVSEILAARQLTKAFSVPTQFQSKIADRVKLVGKEKVIALTFDDGPGPYNTLQVLDILEKNNIKATFFWVGQNVKDYPQIAQKVVTAGHAIGNHTWHHWYRHLDPVTAAREIDDTAELIYKTTGVITFLFRPPGGLINNGVADYAKEKKYAVVMWSVDPMDYRPLPAEKLVNNVIRKAEPGTIVLMHDGGGNHAATVKALPEIIAKLKELGYGFVTVPELLAMKETEQLGIMAKTQLSTSPSVPITQP